MSDTPNLLSWKDLVKRAANQDIVASPSNVNIILRQHPDLRGHIVWNEVSKTIEVKGGILLESFKTARVESIVAAVQDYMSAQHEINVPYQDIMRRVIMTARDNPYDPLKDYLTKTIQWDGTPRIDNWLSTYCGVEDTPYSRAVGRKWMIALVARGIKPGVKVDNVLIMEASGGVGKCLGRGTPVLMFDGSIKPVEQVCDGDLLMGPDSLPRRVRMTTKGVGPLRKIVPIKGDAWVCNDKHVLTVVKEIDGETIDVPISECYSSTLPSSDKPQTYVRGNRDNYRVSAKNRSIRETTFFKTKEDIDKIKDLVSKKSIQSVAKDLGVSFGTVRNALHREPDKQQEHFKFNKNSVVRQIRSGVEFLPKDLPIDPYLIGLWLGDGASAAPRITSIDNEIITFCQNIGHLYNVDVAVKPIKRKEHIKQISFTTGTKKGQLRISRNVIRTFLKTLIVNGEKRIPRDYLVNSREKRLALLAGLVDTDGHMSNGGYSITTKFPGLRDDILFLTRSLGFAAYSKDKHIKKYPDRVYYNVGISGDISVVPCLLPRKQAKPRKQVKNVLKTGFEIQDAGEGEFFGFELDGDGRFLLGDFTVTHNSTIFETLGGEWFCDTAIDIGNKDSQMLAGQYWIIEMAELVSLKRAGHNALKHFISSRKDKFRPPYGASIEESPRRCLLVGTTNETAFLTDDTGNRKYWCVSSSYTKEGIASLKRDRDNLLAEAVAAYNNNEIWYFPYDEIHVTEAEAEQRMVETPVRIRVQEWWYGLKESERPNVVTTLEVAEQALEAKASQIVKDHGLLTEIGHELKKMGFANKRDSKPNEEKKRTYMYYASEKLLKAPVVPRRRYGMPGQTQQSNDSGKARDFVASKMGNKVVPINSSVTLPPPPDIPPMPK